MSIVSRVIFLLCMASFFANAADVWSDAKKVARNIAESVREIKPFELAVDSWLIPLRAGARDYHRQMQDRREQIKKLRDQMIQDRHDARKLREESAEERLLDLLAFGNFPKEEPLKSFYLVESQEIEVSLFPEKSVLCKHYKDSWILTTPGMDSRVQVEFFCPISSNVMTDPVVAADGFSYERQTIQEWILKHGKWGMVVSPKTGLPLKHSYLTPNLELKDRIETYCHKFTCAPMIVTTKPIEADPLIRTTEAYTGPSNSEMIGALEWEFDRSESKRMSFQEANAYVKSRKGWRLPTIWELDAIFQQHDVLEGDFDKDLFWSGTAVANDIRHWYMDFATGCVLGYFPSEKVVCKVCLVRYVVNH